MITNTYMAEDFREATGADLPLTRILSGLEAVFAAMTPEQLREFASGLLTEANRREGYGQQ